MKSTRSPSAGTAGSALSIEQRGNILVVGLARQAKRNAINDPMMLELEEVFSSVSEDVRAIVLHGEGPNFCAGLDLSELTERDAVEGVMHSRMWQIGRAHV